MPDRGGPGAIPTYVYENGQRGVLNIDTGTPDPGLVHTVVQILRSGDPASTSTLLNRA